MGYAEQMAQAIAQARPQHIAGRGGVPFLGGGGHGGIIDNSQVNMNQTQTSASVNLAPIAEALGYETPKQKRDLAQQAMEFVSTKMDPAAREQYYADEKVQKELEKWGKSGSPYIMRNANTNRWEFLPVDPAVKAQAVYGKPDQYNLLGNFYGDQAREQYIKGVTAARAPTEYELAEKSKPGVTGRMVEAGAKEKEATAAFTAGPKSAEALADAAYKGAYAGFISGPHSKEAEANAKLHNAQAENLIKSSPKETQMMLKQELVDHKGITTKLITDPELQSAAKRPMALHQIAAHTIGHIGRVKAITNGDPNVSVGSAATYTGLLSQELARLKNETGMLGGDKGYLNAKDEIHARTYLNDQIRILEELGTEKVPKGLSKAMVGNLAQIANKVKLDDSTNSAFLQLIKNNPNVDFTDLSRVLLSRITKKTPVAPTAKPTNQLAEEMGGE